MVGIFHCQECKDYWNNTKNAADMMDDLDVNVDGMVTKTEWYDFFTRVKKNSEPDDFLQVMACLCCLFVVCFKVYLI